MQDVLIFRTKLPTRNGRETVDPAPRDVQNFWKDGKIPAPREGLAQPNETEDTVKGQDRSVNSV